MGVKRDDGDFAGVVGLAGEIFEDGVVDGVAGAGSEGGFVGAQEVVILSAQVVGLLHGEGDVGAALSHFGEPVGGFDDEDAAVPEVLAGA